MPSLKLDFSQWTQQTQKLLQTYWQLTDLPDFAKYKRQKGYNMHLMSLEPVENTTAVGKQIVNIIKA